jgi:SagB-type dehydrogenase family enzyme
VNAKPPTAEFASLVHGPAGVALDDEAEAFHEASRLYTDVAPGRQRTMLELAGSPELQATVARASRTHDHRPGIALPQGRVGRARLHRVLRSRRSSAPTGAGPLPCGTLAGLLAAGYRSSGGRRPVPSGGALYPLELYPAVLHVDGVAAGVYHYHPYRHRLARLAPVTRAQVAATLVAPELAESAAVLLVVTAVFWRSRFKYGPRGYRFALLEAGHLAQNVLLVAAAAGVSALPVGGFYDRSLDELVGADGLEEAVVYAVLIGGSG